MIIREVVRPPEYFCLSPLPSSLWSPSVHDSFLPCDPVCRSPSSRLSTSVCECIPLLFTRLRRHVPIYRRATSQTASSDSPLLRFSCLFLPPVAVFPSPLQLLSFSSLLSSGLISEIHLWSIDPPHGSTRGSGCVRLRVCTCMQSGVSKGYMCRTCLANRYCIHAHTHTFVLGKYPAFNSTHNFIYAHTIHDETDYSDFSSCLCQLLTCNIFTINYPSLLPPIGSVFAGQTCADTIDQPIRLLSGIQNRGF